MAQSTESPKESFEALEEFEKHLGYRFKDRKLLIKALTHRSYVNERGGQGLEHNEALEFLGDSVLGFLVSARIFRLGPALNEGELSKIKAYLVSAANLVRMAEGVRLGDFLRLSRGEDKTGGRSKRAILVDAYEAVIGAVFLDGGIEVATNFVDRQLSELQEGLDLRHLTYGDYKSALQERLHDMGHPEPTYRVVDELGPDHRKTFVVLVTVRGGVVSEGTGRTKKEAQQAAARAALATIREWKPDLPAAPPP